MRIVCISDTHGLHHRMTHPVPDGDLLLHAGDISRRGRLEDLPAVEAFFSALPHRHRLYIPGNHDWCFERDPEEAKALIPSATCLIDEEIEVEGLRIWGSPWQPEFHDWAFNLPRGEPLAEKWKQIPRGIDVVMTHGPPAGILDTNSRGESVGCRDLRERIGELKPRLHLFGHIHEAYGEAVSEGTRFLNASVCNLGYRPVNRPLVLELDEMPS